MNIIEKIKEKILHLLGLDKLAYDPNDERLTYINDQNDVNKQDRDEARVWYIGDSNELLNYYTKEMAFGNSDEPIYNRNRANYFWGIASTEAAIKRVHSGIPRAIVDTLTNAIGFPIISATGADGQAYNLEYLLSETQLQKKTMQEQIPLTMAIGWGAWKVEVNPKISKFPIVQFYEAKYVEFIAKQDKIVGIIFKDYYQYNGKDYLMLDTRSIDEDGSSVVEYELFRIGKNDELEPADMSEIPSLAGMTDVKIPNFSHILGVPCKFFHNPNNPNYGRSIYYGKYDLFDDLDQSLSQRSQTCRVSTPVEYYPTDMLERDRDGNPTMPSVYNRQYVAKKGIPNGDGAMDGQIQTTQPNLDFSQYDAEQMSILGMILNGVLSPASMGIDIAKKDNADAQREKEKVTIMTRNNVIESETDILKELVKIIMALKMYIDGEGIPTQDFDVSVKFSEFANPSFESLSQTLLPLWQAGAISDEMYVEKLYGDSISKEEKQREIEAIKQNRMRDDIGEGAFESDGQRAGLERDMEAQGYEGEEPSEGKR